VIALISMMGKLEKTPFDIPEAETEVVAGSFTEYGGRMLALFRLAIDVEEVIGATLLVTVFMPFWLGGNPVVGFVIYILKILFVVSLIAVARSVFARLRIDQMIDLCWRYLATTSFGVFLICLAIKFFIFK
jgi:NADH-quinone oxidoreductase subunit H